MLTSSRHVPEKEDVHPCLLLLVLLLIIRAYFLVECKKFWLSVNKVAAFFFNGMLKKNTL